MNCGPDGTIKKILQYVNGDMTGIQKWYFPNGNLKVYANLNHPAGHPLGNFKRVYSEDGQLKHEIFFDESGQLSGLKQTHHKNETIE